MAKSNHSLNETVDAVASALEVTPPEETGEVVAGAQAARDDALADLLAEEVEQESR